MKKILMWAVIAVFTLSFDTFQASAKDIPAGVRMEIAETEDDDNVFTLFTYKDKEGGFAYYLGLGKEYNISEKLDIELLGGTLSVSNIDEVCLCLGVTPEEAKASLNVILSFFDEDANTIAEWPARMSTGSEVLGKPTIIHCVVKKKLIGGKHLKFQFVSGKHSAEADLSKSTVKFLLKALELDMKKHKN